MDGGRGLDDPEEPSTPDERMFDMDSPLLDREKDEEPIKTIRWDVSLGLRLSCLVSSFLPLHSEANVMAGSVERDRKQGGGGERQDNK